MRDKLFRQGLAIGIIILFVGIAVVPSINAIKSTNITTTSKNNGEVDLVVSGMGWWSPAPWLEDENFACYEYNVKNIGDSYNEACSITCHIYYIYFDYEEYKGDIGAEYPYIRTGKIGGGGGGHTENEKPIGIRFEISTSAPESNKQNNVITVVVDYGVTIYGIVYVRDLSGEKHPVKDAWVRCNSEDSPFTFGYSDHTWVDGFYSFSSKKRCSFSI